MYGRPPQPDRYSAAVCRRGHPETSHIELRDEPIPPKCDECGAAILTACPSCQASIRGGIPRVIGFHYDPPAFCHACGSPFPWASEHAIVYDIENHLDEEPDLTEADRRELMKRLAELTDDQADGKRRAAALAFFRKTAPQVWGTVQPAIKVFLTTEVQGHLAHLK